MKNKQIVVSVTREIAAKPREVFEAWNDPKHPASPWSEIKRAIVQPVKDGLFYLCMVNEGKDWPHYGRFVRLDKPKLIEYTWVSPATYGVETRVRITLKPKGAGTQFSLRHTGLPNDAMGRGHQEGWDYFVEALADNFAPRKS